MTADRGRRALPAWLAIVLPAALAGLAFATTSRSLGRVLGGSTSAGLMALACVALVLTLAVSIGRNRAPRQPKLEPALLGAIPLVTAGTALMLFGPARMGHVFWFTRMDVVALVLFFVGAAMSLVGVRAVVRSPAAIVAALVALPPVGVPLVGAVQHLSTDVTQIAARWVVEAFPLGVRTTGDGVFVTGGGSTIAVAEVCAGMEALAAVLLLSGPMFAGLVADGRWDVAKLVAAGLGGAWFANLVRVLLLLAIAGSGATGAFDVVHAVGGAIVIGLATGSMLAVARWWGMRWHLGGLTERVAYRPKHVVTAVGVLGAAVVLVALAQRAQAGDGLRFDTVDGSPRIRYERIEGETVPRITLPGHVVLVDGPLPWFSQFFGSDAHAASYSILPLRADDAVGKPVAWAQVVVTGSRRRLERLGPTNCAVAHGATVYRVRQVRLPGGAGTLVDQRLGRARFSALSWSQRVRTRNGRSVYRRVVLFTPARRGRSRHPVPVATSTTERLAYRVINALSPFAERLPRGWDFDTGGRRAVAIATGMVNART